MNYFAAITMSLTVLVATTPAMAEHNSEPGARAFVQEAYSSSIVEIQTAQLALRTTSSPEVTDYAGFMLETHRTIKQRLEEVADDMRIAVIVPDTASDTLLHELQALDERAFDRAYLAAMVERHETAVALYTQAIGSLPNGQLREYAKAILPKLQNHLNAARFLSNALADS